VDGFKLLPIDPIQSLTNQPASRLPTRPVSILRDAWIPSVEAIRGFQRFHLLRVLLRQAFQDLSTFWFSHGIEWVIGCWCARHADIIFPYGNMSRPNSSTCFYTNTCSSLVKGNKGLSNYINLLLILSMIFDKFLIKVKNWTGYWKVVAKNSGNPMEQLHRRLTDVHNSHGGISFQARKSGVSLFSCKKMSPCCAWTGKSELTLPTDILRNPIRR